MEEKRFGEQVKDCIKQVCESGRHNISFDEFDIEVSFNIERHRKYPFVIENEWDITYKIKLIEKDKKFNHAINSSINPKYIAEYAVIGYKETKQRYEEEQQKKEEDKKSNKQSFFDRLFDK